MLGVGEDERLKCPDCGRTTDTETNFCTNCGVNNRGRWEKVVVSGFTIVEVCLACQMCGKEYFDLAFQFCPDDGKKLVLKRKETEMGIKYPGSK